MALLALTIASCGNKPAASGNADAEEFAVDSLKFYEESPKGIVTLDFDFPREKDTPLADSIRQHISNMLGGTYQGDMNDNQAMINFYGKEAMAFFAEDNEEGGMQWSTSTIFKLDEQTPHYVTFAISTYQFLGGAHGIGADFLTTYHRQSGRVFGSDLLKDTNSDAFGQLLKEGVKSYLKSFEEDGTDITDEELEQQLMLTDDATIDHLPLPALEPALTSKGVSFTYTAYEIAPYVVGTPTFIIDYEKMRPFMTEEALKWIEE